MRKYCNNINTFITGTRMRVRENIKSDQMTWPGANVTKYLIRYNNNMWHRVGISFVVRGEWRYFRL